MPASVPDSLAWRGCSQIFGFAAIVTAANAARSVVLPVWASALIVAAVLLLAAGVAGLISMGQVQQASPSPE